MRLMTSTCLAAIMVFSGITAASAEVNVVASIKPVHALVTAVMEGVGTPALIVQGTGSPHHYALKPSQARLLQNADLVFWIGPNIETFLEKPIEGIATNAISVPLIDSHDLIKISIREGGDFEDHDHMMTMMITMIMTTMTIMTIMMTTMAVGLTSISGWTLLTPRS